MSTSALIRLEQSLRISTAFLQLSLGFALSPSQPTVPPEGSVLACLTRPHRCRSTTLEMS